MPSLTEVLTSEQSHEAVVADCLEILDQEVSEKSGVSGMAIKTGYRTVKGVKPGFLRAAVQDLLPDFAKALEPIHQEGKQKGEQSADYLRRNSGRVADALLAITDEKAERAKTQIVRSTYNKLRGSAKNHVEAAVPRVGQLVEKYAG